MEYFYDKQKQTFHMLNTIKTVYNNSKIMTTEKGHNDLWNGVSNVTSSGKQNKSKDL